MGRTQEKGEEYRGEGWLAGVKETRFYRDTIPLGSQIITDVRKVFDFENYHEISGVIRVGGDLVGEVSVQIVKSVPG